MAGGWHTAMAHTLKHLPRELSPKQARQRDISHFHSFTKLEQCFCLVFSVT